jgi:hypothetical protein
LHAATEKNVFVCAMPLFCCFDIKVVSSMEWFYFTEMNRNFSFHLIHKLNCWWKTPTMGKKGMIAVFKGRF